MKILTYIGTLIEVSFNKKNPLNWVAWVAFYTALALISINVMTIGL